MNMARSTARIILLAALVALAFLTVLASDQPARAATFTVNSVLDNADFNVSDGKCDGNILAPGDQCTLRAAIMEANASAGADTITLGAGTYTLTRAGANENAASTGDLDTTGNLTINGAGASSTIIDANGLDTVFDIQPGANVQISGATIRGGNKRGIFIHVGSTLTLTNTIVSGNTGSTGGGIENRGTLTITSSTISSNTCTNNGGGINNSGTLTVENSVINGNTCGGADPGYGGGIFNTGTATVSNSTISANTAAGHGGGIYSQGASVTVTSSAISGNVARFGGGISSVQGAVTLTNTTISGNTATQEGGGLYSRETATLTSVTIASNGAPSGGGILRSDGSITLKNTIVANSTSGGSCAGGNITSQGFNLDSGSTCGLNQTGDLSNADPRLGPLASNGGPTQTHALLSGSPAIDAGANVGCPATDQRGIGRPLDGNSDANPVCDMGAFEAPLGTSTPTPSCTYVVFPTSQSFAASGGTGSVSVTAPSGCSWTAISTDSWITVTYGNSGSGNGTVTYAVAANASASPRTGTIAIATRAFSVTQAAGMSTPTPTPAPAGTVSLLTGWNLVPYSGGSRPLEQALGGCLPAVDAVFLWSLQAQTYSWWFKGAPEGVNTLATLNAGLLVWVHTTANCAWQQS